jgi:hypothetical protein
MNIKTGEVEATMAECRLVCSGPWKSRRKHASVIWNDCIYIFGGFDGGQQLNLA